MEEKEGGECEKLNEEEQNELKSRCLKRKQREDLNTRKGMN